MKGIKTVLGAILATATMGGAIAVGAASFSAENSARQTIAATTQKTLYVDLKLNSKFSTYGSNPYIHYYNGSDQYVALNHIEDQVYQTASALPIAVFTNKSYGFEVYCYNQAGKGNDCTTTWVYGNGTLQYDNYNYVAVDSYTANQQNKIKGYGFYGTKTTNPGASASTQRIWLKNDTPNFYNNDDWGTQCKNVIGYTYNSTVHYIVMPSIMNAYNSNYYFYADLPASVTDFHFLRMAQSTNHDYLIYLDAYISDVTYGKCYYSGTSNYEDFKNITFGSVSNADAGLLAKVVEAYLTCSDSASNGCATTTVTNLKTTWFDGKSASDSDLSSQTISDYANGDTSYTGNKTKTVSVATKWAAMQSEAGLSSNVVNMRINENNIVPILAITGTAVLFVGAYFFIRKRKHQ